MGVSILIMTAVTAIFQSDSLMHSLFRSREGQRAETSMSQTEMTASRKPTTASWRESIEQAAISYIQEKYRVNCEAVNVQSLSTGCTGMQYSKVWLRPTDKEAAEALQTVFLRTGMNRHEGKNHQDAFMVTVAEKEQTVLADQFIWCRLFPLLDAFVAEKITEAAPCQPFTVFTRCTPKAEPAGNLPYLEFSFPPDFPVITSAEELEAHLPDLKINIEAYLPESGIDRTITQESWNPLENLLFGYPFGSFFFSVYSLPDDSFRQLGTVHIPFSIEEKTILWDFAFNDGKKQILFPH